MTPMHDGAGRPTILADGGMIASGHPLATAAGTAILRRGGNAIDAGVAAGLVLNVVHNEMCSLGGVAPMIVHHAPTGRIETISGLGRWPRAASIDLFEREHGGRLPPGILRCVHPAAIDAWCLALERYGTLRFEDVVGDALRLARDGFPVHELMTYRITRDIEDYQLYDLNRTLFIPDGVHPISPGRRLVLTDLADGLQRLIDAERATSSAGRVPGLRAARDLVFRGAIGREMVQHAKSVGGLFEEADMEDFAVQVEAAIATRYGKYEIHACGPWCQGIVFPMTLNILESFDLKAIGFGSATYFHLIAEALKLAFADRERYVGDPEFVDVPVGGMLSKAYARSRAALIDLEQALSVPVPHGDPWAFGGTVYRGEQRFPYVGDDQPASLQAEAVAAARSHEGEQHAIRDVGHQDTDDTTYVAAIDRDGNIFSCTPSDGYVGVPIVPGVGFSFSKRGSQSWMERDHPSSVAPWKRPRLTPNPALVLRDGRPWMAIGSPGLDIQPQAMLQAFLAHVEFGLPLQAAIEAPRIGTYAFPSSSYPHATAGTLRAEGRIASSILEDLARRGHEVERWPDWTHTAGAVCMVCRDVGDGFLAAGADPRRMNYAMGI